MPVINTHQNIAAFLDMLAVSEGTANHPLTKNRGYDVIVTGLDGKPEIFTDYSDHPFAHGRPAKVFNRRGEKSTASGRYQQLYLFWPHYRKQLALTGLIESLSPSGRRRLSAELAKRLRQSQQHRVMAQKAPDGTPYAPRQQQSARKKTGRVKRKMFAKLITSRFLHIRASPEQASMEFYGGKSPKIASVHQFGLSEENRKDGKKIDYPARPLLGFTGEDVQMIEEIILAHLDR